MIVPPVGIEHAWPEQKEKNYCTFDRFATVSRLKEHSLLTRMISDGRGMTPPETAARHSGAIPGPAGGDLGGPRPARMARRDP